MANSYEVTDYFSVGGVNGINVYHFLVTGTGVDVDALMVATSFAEQVVPLVSAVQSSEVEHTHVGASAIFNSADSALLLIDQNGSRGSNSLPTYDQWSFKFTPLSAVIKSGGKRIAGIVEGDQEEGVAEGAIVQLLNGLATSFLIPLLISGTGVSEVAALGIKSIINNETFLGLVSSAAYSFISTMDSRKRKNTTGQNTFGGRKYSQTYQYSGTLGVVTTQAEMSAFISNRLLSLSGKTLTLGTWSVAENQFIGFTKQRQF